MAREPSKIIDGKVCLTTSAIADVMGVEDRTIQQWGDKGCPKAGRGWWSIKDVLMWRGLVGEGPDGANEKSNWTQLKLEAEAKLKEQQADMAEFKNAINKGEYVLKDEIVEVMTRFFTILKKSMSGYSRTVANEVSAYVDPITTRRIEKMIGELTADVLEQLSIDGIYEPSKKKTKN